MRNNEHGYFLTMCDGTFTPLYLSRQWRHQLNITVRAQNLSTVQKWQALSDFSQLLACH